MNGERGLVPITGFGRPMILNISFCNRQPYSSLPETKRSEPRRWAILVIHLGVSSIPCANACVKIGFFLPVCHRDRDLIISFDFSTSTSSLPAISSRQEMLFIKHTNSIKTALDKLLAFPLFIHLWLFSRFFTWIIPSSWSFLLFLLC
jgi:hypothetical protein